MNIETLLPKSIQQRMIDLYSPEKNTMEILREAIDQENKMIGSLVDGGAWLSTKGCEVASILSKSVYETINSKTRRK